MKLKCKAEEDGSVYLAAINDTGEHRKTATLNPGQEIEIEIPEVADESGVDFGEVVGADGGTPAQEEPADQADVAAASDTPAGDSTAQRDPVEIPAGLGIARAVIYRSKTGKYDLPAVVTATVATLDPKGVELGHVPPLSDASRVHLTVFTCGKQGTSRDGNPVNNEAAGGSYQEFDIPQFVAPETGAEDEPAAPEPGSWRWPERV